MAKTCCDAVPWGAAGGSLSEPLAAAGPEPAPILAAVGVAASLLSCPDPPAFIPLLLLSLKSSHPSAVIGAGLTPLLLLLWSEQLYSEDEARAEATLLFDKLV